MLYFGNLIGFLAVLGVALPVFFHLLSKKKTTPLWIGSVQFLQKNMPKKVKNIQLRELPLLLLRVLLVCWWAMLVALPFWENKRAATEQKKQLFVASDIFLSETKKDSLSKKGVEVFYLYDENTPQNNNNWQQLSKAAQTAQSNEFTILWSNRLSHFQGNKPFINKKYESIFIEKANPKEFSQEAFFTESQPQKVWVFYEETLKSDTKYISKALDAVKAFTKTSFQVLFLPLPTAGEMPEIPERSICFIFSEKPVYQVFIDKKCRIFKTSETEQVPLLLRKKQAGAHVWSLSCGLNEKSTDFVTKPIFLDTVLEILFEDAGKTRFLDHRKVSTNQQKTPSTASKNDFYNKKISLHWFWLVVGVLLIVLERYISRKRADA